jgi:hypothetical protein
MIIAAGECIEFQAPSSPVYPVTVATSDNEILGYLTSPTATLTVCGLKTIQAYYHEEGACDPHCEPARIDAIGLLLPANEVNGSGSGGPESDPIIVCDPADPNVRFIVHPRYDEGVFVGYFDGTGTELFEGTDFVVCADGPDKSEQECCGEVCYEDAGTIRKALRILQKDVAGNYTSTITFIDAVTGASVPSASIVECPPVFTSSVGHCVV